MRPRSLVIALALTALAAGCTEVRDLCKRGGLSQQDYDYYCLGIVAVVDAGGETLGELPVADTAGPGDVAESCSPDKQTQCDALHRGCLADFCSECLPGWAENIAGLCEVSADPCSPDPCANQLRSCEAGICGGCLPGYEENPSGLCISSGDPCLPNPCANINKACLEGFCSGCLPGFLEDPVTGVCLPPNPCVPNPCAEPLKTQCTQDAAGLPVCLCDPGTHSDELGGCTFDPCTPNPCDDPTFPQCTFQGPFAECLCPVGQLKGVDPACVEPPCDDVCVDDPCVPNPCNLYARGQCGTDEETGAVVCSCDPGFDLDVGADACVEGPADLNTPLPEPQGVVTLGDELQILVDDWLVQSREGLARRLHPAARQGDWLIQPELEDAFIGRARANGSLVHVPEAARAAMADDDPLKPYAYRLYYMGYRQLYTFDGQPAWLCLAVANGPNGPWEKPELYPDALAPARHCILRDDGLLNVEVSLVDGQWTASASRILIGGVTTGGVYVYASPDGVTWSLATATPPLALATTATPPAIYARVGERTRMVWDPWEARWTGLLGLPSTTYGDARGVVFGGAQATSGWPASLDPVAAPAILGSGSSAVLAGLVLGDMVAWREGSLWLGLVQRRLKDCPKTAFAVLASSRDGRSWKVVADEVTPGVEGFLLPELQAAGSPDMSIATLTGGAPLAADGLWHFFVGGIRADTCTDPQASGGIFRATVRMGGPAGLEAQPGGADPPTLVTRPMRLRPGVKGAVLTLNARVDGQLRVQVEKISVIDTIVQAAEKVVVAGDYVDAPLAMEPLDGLTDDLFRLRFIFTSGGGELFGFRIGDPLCTPNPCADEELKTQCETINGAAVCTCAAPLHDDGQGGCTEDPCVPDPCTGPHQAGCVADGSEARCECEDGWVPANGVCVPDPCQPAGASDPCPPPGPDRCRAVDGIAECYCPDGSILGPTGCAETDYRAFVTSLGASADAIGGVAGADALCASLANAAGLQGGYAAWLSAPGTNAADRFVGGGPWRTWDPKLKLWVKLVATSRADLIDGELANPIAVTEFASPAPASCSAWTGSTPKGVPPPPIGALGGTCQGWTVAVAGAVGLAGRCDATGSEWTAAGPRECSEKLSIYCLQLPGTNPEIGPPTDLGGNEDAGGDTGPDAGPAAD